MKTFASRLKWLREKNGITQKDMADRLGVSQPYYGRFEKETGQPNLESLVMLPEILNESLDFICGVTNIDSISYDLMFSYLQTRYKYEYSESRLKTTLELLDAEPDVSLERKIRVITRERERMNTLKEDTEKKFKELIDYLKNVPSIPENYLTIEKWDDEYISYVETYKRRPIDE